MPTATPFNNLITFSRGSNATVTGPNGLIQWAPNNLLTFSEQFDNAAWTKVLSASATANTDTAPDGTITADTVVAGASNSAVRQTVTTQADSYTFSCWIKRKTGTGNVEISASGGSWVTQSLTTSWQRFSVTQSLSAGSNFPGVRITTSGDEVYVWGAQLELGSTATTYNPTTVKNLLGFSEAFDNAAWTKTNSSIVTGAQANPVNGLFNAQKLMENTATAEHRAFQSFVLTASPYTLSVYAKPSGRNWVSIGSTAASIFAFFDIANGTVGTQTNCVGTITAAANGWYRVSITFTPSAGSIVLSIFAASANGTVSYLGDGNSGVYIYGAQLSDSASLDPYVPTPGAAPSSTAFYGPRFDYDPVTLQPRGLLVEEQRTNSLKQSADFSGSEWTSINLASRTNNVVAPDGTTTACTIVEDNTNNIHYVLNAPTNRPAPGNVPTTQSIYLKAGTRRYVNVSLEASGNGYNATVDTVGWTITQQGLTGTGWANGSATLTATGGGWYRLTITVTPAAAVTVTLIIAGAPASSSVRQVAYVGDGSSWIVWGAQLEAGAFATSYIPTVASTVTRSADVATITGQNFGQWYRQDEGAFIAEFNVLDQGGVTFTVSDGTGSNRFTGYPAGSVQLEITTGGVLQAALDGGTITPNTNVKVASAYAANNAALSLNGGSAVSDVSVTLPTVNQSRIGANVGGGNLLNGWFRSFRFIPARAADFQLQALTAQTVVDYFYLQTATGDQLVDGNGDDLYSLPIFG